MKKIIYKYVSLYLLTLIVITIISFIDYEVNFSVAGFLSLAFFTLLIFLGFMYQEIKKFQQNQQQEQQIVDAIEKGYQINTEMISNSTFNALLSKNKEISLNLFRLNEQQIKWIHDIKLPLATLQLFINNNKTELTSTQRKTLEVVALEFDQLIEQKLMQDKLTMNVDDYKIEPVMLAEIVHIVIKKLSPMIQLKAIQLTVKLDDEIRINTDQKIIRYCIEQILSNAIKYTSKHGHIGINLYQTKTDEIICTINDNGVGIDSQDISHVFDYGYTGKNGRRFNKNASSGVGLYMVKNNLELLQHTIKITSSPEGTTVQIDF